MSNPSTVSDSVQNELHSNEGGKRDKEDDNEADEKEPVCKDSRPNYHNYDEDRPLIFNDLLSRMKKMRAGYRRRSDADTQAMLVFFKTETPSDDQMILATHIVTSEMDGFDLWTKEDQDDYIQDMHTHVRNLGITAIPESGIGHASAIALVNDKKYDDIRIHMQRMRRYWFHVLRPPHHYTSDPSEEGVLAVDQRALFIADSRLAHERLDVMTKKWIQTAAPKQVRSADLSRFFASLPHEDGNVRQDVASTFLRQYPLFVDMMEVRIGMTQISNFVPLMRQWCEYKPLQRAEIVPTLQIYYAEERLTLLNCILNFASPTLRMQHVFTHWPCNEDTEFVASLMRILRSRDQKHMAEVFFRTFVPVPFIGLPIADEVYFDTFFAPILDAVAPESMYDVSWNLLCTLNEIPAFMVDRCKRRIPQALKHMEYHLEQTISKHNQTMRVMIDRHKVSNQRTLQQLDPRFTRPDVPLEFDPVTEEPLRLEKACCICYENERILCMMPCSHVSSCVACFKRLVAPKTCPECRTRVESVHTVFL